MKRSIVLGIGVLLLALHAVACSKDPGALKREYLANGNAHFNRKEYADAIIEYRKALQVDSTYPEARYKLAQAYDESGDGLNALREYVRAADVMPKDADVQARAGIFLVTAGAFEDAKARALNALALNPSHVDAQLVLAQATAGLKDLDGAAKQMEEAFRKDPTEPLFQTNIGDFRLAEGNLPEAEAAFKRAVALDPNSMVAVVSLARFYQVTGKTAEAEDALKKALALKPEDPAANRSLAALYFSTNRMAEAEAPLKAWVATAPPAARLVLADYYIKANRVDEARKTLDSAKDDPVVFSAARVRYSILEKAAGNAAAANKWLDEALARDAGDPDANIVKGRYLLSEGKLAEARNRFKTAVDAAPQSAEAHYWLATSHMALRDAESARQEFLEVQKLAPTEVQSKIQLARLELQAGQLASAETFANDAVRLLPRDGRAHLVRVDVLTAAGKLEPALKAALLLSQLLPKVPDPQLRLARIYLKQKDYRSAETALRRAIEISSNDREAYLGLVDVLIATNRLREAQQAVEEWVKANPEDAGYNLLAARVYRAQHDDTRAESALKKVLTIDPANVTAYKELSQIYFAQNRLDEARGQLESIVARQPKAIWAHTLIAMSFHLQNRIPEARERYERILSIDPRAATASNNLAIVLLQNNETPDRALTLAQTAIQQVPDSPEFNDTLGMVYLKKGLGTLAVPPLELAVRKDPANPEFQYHLGQAYIQIGRKADAQAALQKALASKTGFAGADDARKLLTSLGESPRKAG